MPNYSIIEKNRDSVIALIAIFLLSLAIPAVNAACDSQEHKAFDFWLGEWQVKTPTGKVAGTNTIVKQYKDCVLREKYSTPTGYSGESFNTYDAGRKIWHQTWVDNANTLLLLEGGLKDGKMVLEGETIATDGQVTKHRITWTANDDGSVRQFWQSTNVKGEWETAFDGLYTKM
jgi:hypothetical protein